MPVGRGLDFLAPELDELARQGLLRAPVPLAGQLVLCSNDYLGAARDGDAEGTLSSGRVPVGSGASRLVSGEHDAHRQVERVLSEWVGLEDALLFSSGYAANVGMIAALARRGDRIVSDALNHASIIDGCRLSRASVEVTPHLDVDAVARALESSGAAGRRFVITEAYFSMDGDVPDLAALRRVCDRFGAVLIVDEAHSLGIFGQEGRGLCCEAGIVPDVLVGTLGKAVGMQGAFVAGSRALKSWLWNRARSFVFSTGVSPALAAATVQRVAKVRADEGGRMRLESIVSRVREALARAGAPILPSRGPILPWVVGDPRRAIELRDRLLARGVFVQAIRPPTVPEGSSRLRITLHARLTETEVAFTIERLLELLDGDVAPHLG